MYSISKRVFICFFSNVKTLIDGVACRLIKTITRILRFCEHYASYTYESKYPVSNISTKISLSHHTKDDTNKC